MRTSILSCVTMAGLVAFVTACSSADPVGVVLRPVIPLTISSAYGIAASAITVRDPSPRIRYSVRITNGSTSDEQVDYGACWATVQLFTSEARTDKPMFDSGSDNQACTAQGLEVTIAPGDSTELVGYLAVEPLLAAGIAPGHYYVSVIVAPNGSTTDIAAGAVDVQP